MNDIYLKFTMAIHITMLSRVTIYRFYNIEFNLFIYKYSMHLWIITEYI